jgi:serine/threonine-protein kinase
VVDWGLAKAQDRPDAADASEEQPLRPASAGGTAETVQGSAIGTPQYMSPEQAAGRLDRLGPATDVYSLGATLYCLLTGQTPFTGPDVGAVLRQVQRGEFPPPRQHDRGIHPALEAICLKALALAPEDRYRTALELASDVEHWLADEPVSAWPEPWPVRARRWLGRHRTLVTGAAAAVLVAVASLAAAAVLLTAANDRERAARGLAEQNEKDAREQHDKAERNFQLARDAVDRYHTKVSENRLLNEPGLQPLRKELLETAREFYDRFVEERAGDPGVRADLARALGRLASITAEIESRPKAIALHQQALAIWEELAREHPDRADDQKELAECHRALARLYDDTGKRTEAEAALLRAVAAGEELVRRNPGVSRFQAVLGRSLLQLGHVYGRNKQNDRAEEAYQRALKVLQQRALDRPDDADCQAGLAICQGVLAGFYLDTGRAAKAEEGYQQAQKVLETLVAKNPGVEQYEDLLARSYQMAGIHYLVRGEGEKAAKAYATALPIWERLARAHSANRAHQENLADVLSHLYFLYTDAKKAAEAEKVCRRALPILEKLAGENPAVIKYQETLAENLENLAGACRESKQLAEAEKAYQRAIESWGKLARKPSTNAFTAAGYQEHRAFCHRMLARVYADNGKTDRREATLREAVAAYEELARMRPGAARPREGVADCSDQLGLLYVRAGRADKAEEAYHKALAVRKQLAGEQPRHTSYRQNLAAALDQLGLLYDNAARRREAESAYKEALVIREKLADAPPQSAPFLIARSGSYNALGWLALRAGEDQAGLDWFDRAIHPLEPVLKQEGRNASAKETLCRSHWGRANALMRLKRAADALEAWDRALALDDGPYRNLLPLGRACAVAVQGDHASAVAVAQGLVAKAPENGTVLANAAYVYGQASAAALRDAGLAKADRDKLTGQYASRAVELLAGAATREYYKTPASAATLKTDKLLDPLRSRADFKKLLAAVEAAK